MAKRKDKLPYSVDYDEYTAKVTQIAASLKISKAKALSLCIDEMYRKIANKELSIETHIRIATGERLLELGDILETEIEPGETENQFKERLMKTYKNINEEDAE